MIAIATGPHFPMGAVVITANALAAIPAEEVRVALGRHSRGDWGELDAHDRAVNEQALRCGERIFSIYRAANGTKFYIITEHDRSRTTILLPEDY